LLFCRPARVMAHIHLTGSQSVTVTAAAAVPPHLIFRVSEENHATGWNAAARKTPTNLWRGPDVETFDSYPVACRRASQRLVLPPRSIRPKAFCLEPSRQCLDRQTRRCSSSAFTTSSRLDVFEQSLWANCADHHESRLLRRTLCSRPSTGAGNPAQAIKARLQFKRTPAADRMFSPLGRAAKFAPLRSSRRPLKLLASRQ